MEDTNEREKFKLSSIEGLSGKSRTDHFRKHLALIISDNLGGMKISMPVAWKIFKDLIYGSFQYVLAQGTLPLAGIGKFEIIKNKPKHSKAGLDLGGNVVGEAWDFVPKFRFRPTIRMNTYLEKFYGFRDNDIEIEPLGLFKKRDKKKEN